MWFKNLIIYRLSTPIELSENELETRLEEFSYRPCASQEKSKYGWSNPMGKHGQSLLHLTNGNILLCAKKEDKMLPAAVVKEALDEKVQQIENETARSVKKKEKDALKEEIEHRLLPRAFSRLSTTFAYIAPKMGLIFVDASSHNKAEDLLALLRKSIGSLAVLPLQTKSLVEQSMTSWISDDTPAHPFTLLEEAELKSPLENGAIIRCKNQDLQSDELKAHIENGMQVVKIAIQYAQSLTCILNDDLTIKRIKFTDVITEQTDEQDKEDKAACFDADFAIMTGEFEQFIPALLDVLGGEER